MSISNHNDILQGCGNRRVCESYFLSVVHDKSNQNLVQYLDVLLNNDDLLTQVACLSYRHQLGFRKFTIMTDDKGYQLRLHLWDSHFDIKEDIHSHCANFRSRIVLGRLSENTFGLVDGNKYARFRYSFDAAARHSIAIADGFTDVYVRERRTLVKGDIYEKRASDFHSICEAREGTVSISAWEPRNREALVLKSHESNPEDCEACVGMSASIVKEILFDIKGKIENK